jgi:hypothetical protein
LEVENTMATYGNGIHMARLDLQEVITKVTLCPVQLFSKMPKIPTAIGSIASSSSEAPRCLVGYKYCDRGFIANMYVPLSCGCKYHLLCMMETILSGRIQCIQYSARIHGTWMATWGFTLDNTMQCQVKADQVHMDANRECVALVYHSLASARTPFVLVHLVPAANPPQFHVALQLQQQPQEEVQSPPAREAVHVTDPLASVTTNTPPAVLTSLEVMLESATSVITSPCACSSD